LTESIHSMFDIPIWHILMILQQFF
jgi:hypothetical protein